MRDIKNEINVVENMIRMLNECLDINLKRLKKEEAKQCLLDIKYCKNELNKLKIELKNEANEEVKNVAK